MARKEIPVTAYYSAELCECGGIFDKKGLFHDYSKSPVIAEFNCSGCGIARTFEEPDFPGVRFRREE